MSNIIKQYQARVQKALGHALSDTHVPKRLNDSMRYSTLAGGKRFRALLVYAAGTALDAPLDRLDKVAAALECLHAYSLIHDDLPAMDDDDLRRGQATNHIKYDDATAILAGDALQALAFELVSNDDSTLTNKQSRTIVTLLAKASGPNGMVGGQMLDIQATEQKLTREQLENVHRRKTGALINAAVMCGAFCSDSATDEQLRSLNTYADHLGLAFQIIDDILDIESSTEELGKPNGADVALGKSTYPSLIGLQESKKLAADLYHKAIDCIDTIGDNNTLSGDQKPDKETNKCGLLHTLAELVIKRTH